MLAFLPPCNNPERVKEKIEVLLTDGCQSRSASSGPWKPRTDDCHDLQALMESVFICGGGSAVPGVGPKLLQSISAHLPPSVQPVLCPVPEYMPKHAGTTAEPPASRS